MVQILDIIHKSRKIAHNSMKNKRLNLARNYLFLTLGSTFIFACIYYCVQYINPHTKSIKSKTHAQETDIIEDDNTEEDGGKKHTNKNEIKIISEDFLNDWYVKPKDNVIFLKEVPELILKLDKIDVVLGDLTEIWQGLIAYGKKGQPREYTSEVKVDDSYRKLLYGGNIKKYSINWAGEYLSYGNWLHRPRPSYIFDKPKILIQRIRNPKLVNRIIGALDFNKHLNGTGLSNILLKDDVSISLEFLLGLINSKLINYWFGFYFSDVNIKPEQLRKIPIIKNFEIEKNITNKVIVIQNVKQEKPKADTSLLEKEIDQMVYELYGLTEEEIKIVENSFLKDIRLINRN